MNNKEGRKRENISSHWSEVNNDAKGCSGRRGGGMREREEPSKHLQGKLELRSYPSHRACGENQEGNSMFIVSSSYQKSEAYCSG